MTETDKPVAWMPGQTGAALVFDDGILNLNRDGSGNFTFREDVLEWEHNPENGKDYRYANLPASEIMVIRDELNKWFPPASVSPTSAGQSEEVVDNPWAKFKLWLFRECNEGTRRHLWALFGLPTDEIRNHGHENHALRFVKKQLTSALDLPAIQREARREALEEAAKVADSVADDFPCLSVESPMPNGAVVAAKHIAAAIRALKEGTGDE